MLKIGIDCHVHTLFSKHAFCTVRDNVMEAAERGLEGVGIADHYGGTFLGITEEVAKNPMAIWGQTGHFLNVEPLPETWHGVRLYKSIEADIVDTKGNLFGYDISMEGFGPGGGKTLDEVILGKTDYAIASVHFLENSKSITTTQGTEMYCGALQNPKVYILGHIGRAGIPFDIDEVLTTAKKLNKIIEINNHSFNMGTDAIRDICRAIAIRCAELGVWIAINSDAHCSSSVGEVPKVQSMLEEIGFPQELVANESCARFDSIIGQK